MAAEIPQSALYQEILNDVADLVRAAAHPRTGTVSLAPETAELLERLASASPAEISTQPPAPAATRAQASETPPSESGDAVADLAALAKEVAACTKCALCESRTQTVFSDGSPTADLMFVGEAPGYNEDQQGVPFVGRAGQLLTDIIEKGMKLRRQDVYICNVLKCRPPENRDPTPEEKRMCMPYLMRQIELVQPKVICALGGHAATTLLDTTESTGRLRGKWHFLAGVPVRVTYHPAYLLRSPGEKRKTWEDVQAVMKVLSGEFVPQPDATSRTLFD